MSASDRQRLRDLRRRRGSGADRRHGRRGAPRRLRQHPRPVPLRSTAGRARSRQADEVAALFKARADKAEALIGRIAELHSYDVPAAVVWPIAAALARLCRLGREERGLTAGRPLRLLLERQRPGRDGLGVGGFVRHLYRLLLCRRDRGRHARRSGTPIRPACSMPRATGRDRRHRAAFRRGRRSSSCSARSS